MRKIISPIERPSCPCGGPTYLERIDSHPIHGKGFEVRVFACVYCGREATTETTPDNIAVAPEQPRRRSMLSIGLDKLRAIRRSARARRRSAGAEPTAS